MEKWRLLIDQKAQEIIGDGDISHLPGAGEPLQFDDDDTHVPKHLRMAHKIMSDHDVMPSWVMMGADLDKERAKIEKFAKVAAQTYQRRLQEARQAASFIMERDADKRWDAARERIEEQAETYNQKVLAYNLALPAGISHKTPLDARALINQA